MSALVQLPCGDGFLSVDPDHVTGIAEYTWMPISGPSQRASRVLVTNQAVFIILMEPEELTVLINSLKGVPVTDLVDYCGCVRHDVDPCAEQDVGHLCDAGCYH